MGEEIPEDFSMEQLISAIAPADSCVADWIPLIGSPISPVAFAV